MGRIHSGSFEKTKRVLTRRQLIIEQEKRLKDGGFIIKILVESKLKRRNNYLQLKNF